MNPKRQHAKIRPISINFPKIYISQQLRISIYYLSINQIYTILY